MIVLAQDYTSLTNRYHTKFSLFRIDQTGQIIYPENYQNRWGSIN